MSEGEKSSKTGRDLLLLVVAVCGFFGIIHVIASGLPDAPAPTYQQKVIQQNTEWRNSVCKDLGCK